MGGVYVSNTKVLEIFYHTLVKEKGVAAMAYLGKSLPSTNLPQV